MPRHQRGDFDPAACHLRSNRRPDGATRGRLGHFFLAVSGEALVNAAGPEADDGVLAEVARQRIVPVVVIDDVSAASPLAEALADAGLGCAEITLRTSIAIEVIARFAETGRLVVGAGTVLDPQQASAAIDAGARFVVSPGFDSEVVHWCQQFGVPVVPGTATPSDIQQAWRAGVTAVKFFPAETLGGVAALAAMSAPFPGMTFVPTGGITPANVTAYLQHPAVLAVGGSWMAPRQLIAAGDWGRIGQLAAEAAELAAEYPAAVAVVDNAAGGGWTVGVPRINGQRGVQK